MRPVVSGVFAHVQRLYRVYRRLSGTTLREAMEAGAWGMGAGPEYRPGRFSTTEEIIELAHVVAEYDGFYYSHQRSQSPLPLWLTPSIVDEYTPPPTWPAGWRLTATDGMNDDG